MHELRVGISGWTYPKWRGVFYPKKLSHKLELEYATAHMSTIEINGTFYRLQTPATFRNWYERAPENFVFSVKGNQFITHAKRLRDPEPALANFFATGILELGEKLGPILWQFPPSFKLDLARFEDFFAALPRTPRRAVALARTHEKPIRGSEKLRAPTAARLRYAVEVRDDSFRDDRFLQLLSDHNVAYVIADTAGRWYNAEEVTADFVYLRLHGFKELYSGGYTPAAIRSWARKIRKWTEATARGAKRDAFIYFDNDAKVNAPFDATSLMLELERSRALVHPHAPLNELVAQRKTLKPAVLKQLQDRALNR